MADVVSQLGSRDVKGSPLGPCYGRRGTVRSCERWPETESFPCRDYVGQSSLWGRVEEEGRESQGR